MTRVAREIVINAPRQVVYNQWTQFEDFPAFMEGVEEVKQLDDRHLAWSASIAGRPTRWDAEIVEQIPDETIAWRSLSGPRNAGIVTFKPADEGQTAVHLELSYEPRNFVENVADALGLIRRRVERDLEEFKEFIEVRQTPTGGWRGEIHREEGWARTEETLRDEAEQA